MKATDIHLEDWQRILVGNVPGQFYIEVLLRLVFLFALLLTTMRLMGKRMGATLTRNELGAMVVIAAAIGAPIQAPERGILPAVIIAIIVVLTERGISSLAYKNQRFETFSQGNISTLVADSVLDIKSMKRSRISKERVLSQLRSVGITHLGQVKRLYLDAGGDITLIRETTPRAGLTVIPDWDTEFTGQQKKSGKTVCANCGKEQKTQETECGNCHCHKWIGAVE